LPARPRYTSSSVPEPGFPTRVGEPEIDDLSGIEDADPTGADKEPNDDQDDPPQDLALGQDRVDPGDDQDYGDDPQQETHVCALP
jgi:hypothetical protein